MKIAGIQKNSFIDYPGKISAVLFTQGCNMDCFFCHNRELIKNDSGNDLLCPSDVLEFLRKRKKLLEGVVISGGEPTLQPGLAEFIRTIKKEGYPVKLDTNGTNPSMLKQMIEDGLLDYVAMDIKAPLHKYAYICGKDVNTGRISESINILLEGKVDYEFRTTFVPCLDENDILEIAEMIKGAKKYVLQQFRKPDKLGNAADIRNFQTPHSDEYIMNVADRVKTMVAQCGTRGLNH